MVGTAGRCGRSGARTQTGAHRGEGSLLTQDALVHQARRLSSGMRREPLEGSEQRTDGKQDLGRSERGKREDHRGGHGDRPGSDAAGARGGGLVPRVLGRWSSEVCCRPG